MIFSKIKKNIYYSKNKLKSYWIYGVTDGVINNCKSLIKRIFLL